MTSPVLMVNQNSVEKDVEEIFQRSDVRALPVVDDDGGLVGLVTYKELSAAQTRLNNKRKKAEKKGDGGKVAGAKVKGWMLQHVRTVGEEQTLSEAETVLLDGDFGVIPVVEGKGGDGGGGGKVKGLITRTDMLRQHQYYDTLHYNNKAFADKIADRKGIVALRKKLKAMDMEE